MTRLYLRSSLCGGLSLLTPDVQLLKSADLHIDIVKKDVHYSGMLYKRENIISYKCIIFYWIKGFSFLTTLCVLSGILYHTEKIKEAVLNFTDYGFFNWKF